MKKLSEEEDEEEIKAAQKAADDKAAADKVVKDELAAAKLPAVNLNEKPNRMIDDANLAAKRTEDATAALKVQNDRAEALKVETTLGGKADAGQPSQTEDQKDIAASKKLLEGTGFEDILDEPSKEPVKFTKGT